MASPGSLLSVRVATVPKTHTTAETNHSLTFTEVHVMMNVTWPQNKNNTIGFPLILMLLMLTLSPTTFADKERQSHSQPPGLIIYFNSRQTPPPLNQMHQWEIRITDLQGQPVNNATIQVSGGMPAHDHGLATSPRVTQNLGDGKYLLEGVRFHMPGLWKLEFNITVEHQHYRIEETITL
jgi:hypothetical protein